MRTTLPLTIALAALSIASTGWSQTADTDTKPAMAASMPHDSKDMMGSGGHGDAKGMAMGKDMPCAAQPAASAAGAKKKLKHDHAKFHKNQ